MDGTIVLTGFEAFGGEEVNPSGEVALSLDGVEIPAGGTRARVSALVLPVTWEKAFGPLEDILQNLRRRPPLAVVMLGQAGGRPGLSVERVAINVANGKDNDGVECVEEAVVAGGPPAYFSTLPLRAVASRVESLGLPASISNTAGTYLCNYVFYRLMHHLREEPDAPRAGFIHIPYLPRQAVGKKPLPPSMAAADLERALRGVLAVTLGEML